MNIKYVVILVVLTMFISSCGFEIVDTGFRGVQTRYGEVQGTPLPEGLHFYNPITSDIRELDVREQSWEGKALCYTKDIQNVDIVFVVNYYPEKSEIHKLYQNIGVDWANKILPQIVTGKIKEVVGQYEAVSLVSGREKATLRIRESITDALAEKNIILKDFQLKNLDFNDAFENAVEQKVVAIENAKAAQNKTVQIQEEANQKVISATAEANSMKIRAEALSQNKGLVEYEAVMKWNGVTPTIVLGDNAIPFLNIDKAQ